MLSEKTDVERQMLPVGSVTWQPDRVSQLWTVHHKRQSEDGGGRLERVLKTGTKTQKEQIVEDCCLQ